MTETRGQTRTSPSITPSKRGNVGSVPGLLLFFGDHHGDFHRDVLVQPHRHLVLAQLPDGVVQLNLAPVDVVVLRGQSFSDILARHRAEQLIVLAGLLHDPDGRPGHDLGQIFGLTLNLDFLAEVRLTFLLHDLLVGFGGRHGHALGQQEIAGVPRCDLDYLPPDAQLFDVFSENDFHISSRLERGRERQQRDVPRLLDRVREPALVRRAHARNAARHDLAPLRHEGVQHLHVLVVDIVDLLDAEPAYLLAPEILLLLGGNRLVAARGALRRAAWSSFRFRHGLCLLRQARKGRARYWSRYWWFRHLLRQGRLRRNRRGRGIQGALGRPLVPFLLALVQPLQRLVRCSQTAFQFLHHRGLARELEEHVCPLPVLVHAISQPALAPLVDFVYGSACRGQLRPYGLYERIDLFVWRIRLYYEQLFVNPCHASSMFKPGARRLYLVMAFSTPSAIMERTASAAKPTNSSNSFICERLIGASTNSAPSRIGWPGRIPNRTRTISL